MRKGFKLFLYSSLVNHAAAVGQLQVARAVVRDRTRVHQRPPAVQLLERRAVELNTALVGERVARRHRERAALPLENPRRGLGEVTGEGERATTLQGEAVRVGEVACRGERHASFQEEAAAIGREARDLRELSPRSVEGHEAIVR